MSYYFFYIYAILITSCPVIAIRAIFRRDNDAAAVVVLLFFLSIIGLFSNYAEFARIVSIRHGFVWFSY